MNKSNRFIPLWLALAAIVGIVVGTFYGNHFQGNRLNIINSGSNKLSNLLFTLDDQYVDSVDVPDLVEKAIPLILGELDPHSVYISTKDVEMANDDLRGSFSGVGIEFIIRNDTLRVQNVISGGPAEQAGLIAGDKIVTVDDSTFTGPTLTNEYAMHTLKGPQGTEVKLGVVRYGEKDVREFTVTRDQIVTHSVTAAYMLDETTGYIRIKNFSDNTYEEVVIALAQLSMEGFEQIVVDLRGNSGGYLHSAVEIANQFLPRGSLIVYTEGRRSPREEYRSNGHGSYKQMPLVVLIDEGSASASEILAGAIQDNDRGTIIGRRSFGKGLVQQPLEFTDGSMMRLTIARYYTPSGRCIQKPYTSGMDRDYEEDLLMRYQNGEFFSLDSIKHTGPEYYTTGGRTVYGGGGITPDIFVPEDTTDFTTYYREATYSGLILQFGYDYTDQNRQKLSEFENEEALVKYLKRQNLVEKFAQYADSRGLKRRNLMIQRSHHLLEEFILSRIVYNMLDEQSWLQYLNHDDPAVKEALRIMKEGKAFPQPAENDKKDDDKKSDKVAQTFDYRATHLRPSLVAKS
ncbi:MAG: S41 family peptidase [Prevotella sp.]|nr:S41 family peptidase [Prevotella sp.]